MNKDYIYKRRLLKLADFLDKLPRQRFNFRKWVGYDWQGKGNLSCGTTACGLGWATTIPSFRRAGLRLKKLDFGDRMGVVTLVNEPTTPDGPSRAAAHVFGLANEEYEFLFLPGVETGVFLYGRSGPDIDATPKELSKHIRFFVRNRY